MTDQEAKCVVCGEPMPPGETMFKFHGYSGNCPKPPLKSKTLSDQEIISRLADALRQAIKDLEYCGEKHSNSLLSHGVKCAMEAEQVLKELGLEKVE